MALYVSFHRALRGHATIWYELLEEENVVHGGCHEVTGDVHKHKHITALAQRRLSIERVGVKDGAFLATFDKGAIDRARSESISSFVSKLMHEHLATEARQEMWAGQSAGSVTCGGGCVLRRSLGHFCFPTIAPFSPPCASRLAVLAVFLVFLQGGVFLAFCLPTSSRCLAACSARPSGVALRISHLHSAPKKHNGGTGNAERSGPG